MYISEKKYDKRGAMESTFIVGGEKVIAILECKANAKKNIQYLIDNLNSYLGSYGIQREIEKIRKEEEKEK
jgi:hypothetical protein